MRKTMSAIFGNYSPAFCSNPFVVTTTNAVMLSLSKHIPIYNQSFDKLKMTATKVFPLQSPACR